jgi:hypothetical protein
VRAADAVFTGDLIRLVDWLRACGIKTVVMEGVYWIALYELLEYQRSRCYDVRGLHPVR